MVEKNKNQARLRLVVNNECIQKKTNIKARTSRDSLGSAPRRRVAKVRRKGLNRGDAGVSPLLAGDLLDAPLRDVSVLGDARPLPFTFLQLVDYVGMDGFSHAAEGKPVFGLMQPGNGADIVLRSLLMVAGRPQKVVTPKDIIGQILIENIEMRWVKAFPLAKTNKDRLEALSRRSGVGKETLRMIIRGEQSPRIDTVDKVARALGTTCNELLKVMQEEDEIA